MPTPSHAVDRHLGKNCELTICDSDIAVADVASEPRKDLINGQLIPFVPASFYQDFVDTSLQKLCQHHGLRPVLHKKTVFVN